MTVLRCYSYRRLLRTHSLENDPEDDYSRIKEIKFEPTTDSHIFVAIGQDCLVLIDAENGDVLSKFRCPVRNDILEELYSVDWTYITNKETNALTNILATGGLSRSIYIIQPKSQSWIECLRGHKSPINIVRFSPSRPYILISVDMMGLLIFWELSQPTANNKPRNKSKRIGSFQLPFHGSCLDVYDMQISFDNIILINTTNGLYYLPNVIDERKTINTLIKPILLKLSSPILTNLDPDISLFTCIAWISKHIIVAKMVKVPYICVCKIFQSNETIVNNINNADIGLSEIKMNVIGILEDSSTNQFYNGEEYHITKLGTNIKKIDVSYDKVLVLAGNNKGTVCVWDISSTIPSHNVPSHSFFKRAFDNPLRIKPVHIINWVNQKQITVQNETIPEFATLDTSVNAVDISSDYKYIVTSTNCNLIGIIDSQ